jgi:hypothetical protein
MLDQAARNRRTPFTRGETRAAAGDVPPVGLRTPSVTPPAAFSSRLTLLSHVDCRAAGRHNIAKGRRARFSEYGVHGRAFRHGDFQNGKPSPQAPAASLTANSLSILYKMHIDRSESARLRQTWDRFWKRCIVDGVPGWPD